MCKVWVYRESLNCLPLLHLPSDCVYVNSHPDNDCGRFWTLIHELWDCIWNVFGVIVVAVVLYYTLV